MGDEKAKTKVYTVTEEIKEEKKEEKKPNESGPIALILLVFLLGVMGLVYMKFPDLGKVQSLDSVEEGEISLYDFIFSPGDSSSGGKNSVNTQSSTGTLSSSDILRNARNYLAKGPVYRDGYYESGYPNDNYGVCTDVVAFALRDSGMDLMELVYQDELEHPDAYDVDVPDKCIDFRRVKNLLVYFQNHAISLTKDIYDETEWKGGDIVLWEDHAGIVSDKKNERGVSYILHNTQIQEAYEEDILEENVAIVGHFRIR